MAFPLSVDKTEKLMEDYLFAERQSLRDEVLELIEGEKPSLLQSKKLGDRILSKTLGFVETFINGMTDRKAHKSANGLEMSFSLQIRC